MRRLIGVLLLALAIPVVGRAEPNISGVWRLSRPPRAPAEATPPIPSPPLRPEFAAPYEAQQARMAQALVEGRPFARDQELCVPLGMPRMLTTDNPLEILQTPGRITMIVEFLSQVRRIDLTRRSHAPPETLSEGFYGDSVGHWEGDVLVVDTVGLKGRVLLFNDAPHSDALRIVERIRLVTPDILADEVTITDPKVLTGPWIVTRVFVRQPDLMIGEFVCEDNNPYYRDTDGRLALHRRPAGN
jgi:hypothetical protein